jgi:hypothetical protein
VKKTVDKTGRRWRIILKLAKKKKCVDWILVALERDQWRDHNENWKKPTSSIKGGKLFDQLSEP